MQLVKEAYICFGLFFAQIQILHVIFVARALQKGIVWSLSRLLYLTLDATIGPKVQKGILNSEYFWSLMKCQVCISHYIWSWIITFKGKTVLYLIGAGVNWSRKGHIFYQLQLWALIWHWTLLLVFGLDNKSILFSSCYIMVMVHQRYYIMQPYSSLGSLQQHFTNR